MPLITRTVMAHHPTVRSAIRAYERAVGAFTVARRSQHCGANEAKEKTCRPAEQCSQHVNRDRDVVCSRHNTPVEEWRCSASVRYHPWRSMSKLPERACQRLLLRTTGENSALESPNGRRISRTCLGAVSCESIGWRPAHRLRAVACGQQRHRYDAQRRFVRSDFSGSLRFRNSTAAGHVACPSRSRDLGGAGIYGKCGGGCLARFCTRVAAALRRADASTAMDRARSAGAYLEDTVVAGDIRRRHPWTCGALSCR